MKFHKVVVVVLLTTVSLVLFIVYAKNNQNTNPKSVKVSNTTSSDSNDKLLLDTSKDLSAKDTKKIMKKIDSRVRKVKHSLNYEYYKDHYDRDILVFRYFSHGVESESLTGYKLYYDEQGKLIYANITHYRGALYSIYFHNDELLHVEVGPFITDEGQPFINGDMANVKAVIKKDPSYAFVLGDISLCLEHAYKQD